MGWSTFLILFTLLISSTSVHGVTPSSTGRQGYGLIGYGINMYEPVCCSACKNIAPTYLYCNPEDVNHEMHGMSMVVLSSRQMHDHMGRGNNNNNSSSGKVATEMGSSQCKATNQPYLQTIAYCMKTHCDSSSVTVADIEGWWWLNVVGVMPDQPNPSMTYQESLASIMHYPNATLPEDTPLSEVVLVDEESYEAQWNILVNFERAETLHGKYSIIIIATCFILPIFLSSLRFLPFPTRLSSLFNAHVIEAPLYNGTIFLPLFGQLSLPTRGQSLFVLWLLFINLLCCSVGFKSVQPNAWWTTRTLEIATYVSNRAGAISFANIPLLILYAGRSNLLLWLTNWSFSTFILLHKCVGVLATIEACLHSAIYLQIYLSKGLEHYNEESKSPYWIMGIIATLSMSLILPCSIRNFRKKMYELFVIIHIALAILTIVGCWYHIIWRYDHQWGYELWMYVALGVWGFDRVFRLVRMIGAGMKYAVVYQIDQDYLRLDIPNVKGYSGNIYVYFLNVNWKQSVLPRPWESHPFSIASFNLEPPNSFLSRSNSGSDPKITPKLESSDESQDQQELPVVSHNTEKHQAQMISSKNGNGITILLRMEKGITRGLEQFATPLNSSTSFVPRSIPILIEGSYGTHGSGHFLNEYVHESNHYPNILCISGGVGITALLPKLSSAASSPFRNKKGTIKLYWSSRSQALVDAVEEIMIQQNQNQSSASGEVNVWGNIEAHVEVGTRLHLSEIIDKELTKNVQGNSGGTLVIVSGPKGMADEVRKLVVEKGKQGILVKFIQDSFDW